MVLALKKRAIGVFESEEETQDALDALNDAGFPMDNILVATKDNIPDGMDSPDREFLEHRTVESLSRGAIAGSALGAIAGLFAGMTTLFMPGFGPIAIAGPVTTIAGLTAAGGFYGALGGAIVGTVSGDELTEGQTQIYNQHLTRGHYVVRLEGTDEQIARSESILRDRSIQEWRIYQATENS